MEARTPPRYAVFPDSRPHQLSAIAPLCASRTQSGRKRRDQLSRSVEDAAIFVASRRHSLLPLDGCLYTSQATIRRQKRSSLQRQASPACPTSKATSWSRLSSRPTQSAISILIPPRCEPPKARSICSSQSIEPQSPSEAAEEMIDDIRRLADIVAKVAVEASRSIAAFSRCLAIFALRLLVRIRHLAPSSDGGDDFVWISGPCEGRRL